MSLSPGPWELSPDGDVIFDAHGNSVAVRMASHGSEDDMRLMCSAPSLRAALKALLTAYGLDGVADETLVARHAREPDNGYDAAIQARAALKLPDGSGS